jgi:hypothetical protein
MRGQLPLPIRTPAQSKHSLEYPLAFSAADYEAFMLTLQELCVLEILPHESAETSNTDSNLTDGVLYGFFAAACSVVFSFEVSW